MSMDNSTQNAENSVKKKGRVRSIIIWMWVTFVVLVAAVFGCISLNLEL